MAIPNSDMLQMVLVAFCGALIGEAAREVGAAEKITLVRFAVEFLATAFVSVMVGVILQEMFFDGKSTVLIPLVGFLAYSGRHKIGEIMDKVFDTVIRVKDELRSN